MEILLFEIFLCSLHLNLSTLISLSFECFVFLPLTLSLQSLKLLFFKLFLITAINSFSFIFSSRPGTKASKLNEIDKNISKERLIELQSLLFKNQTEHNKSLENKEINVLVENKLENQNKFFGRNEYFNSVIFESDINEVGKTVKVNIEKSNQNTLFGKVINKMKAA